MPHKLPNKNKTHSAGNILALMAVPFSRETPYSDYFDSDLYTEAEFREAEQLIKEWTKTGKFDKCQCTEGMTRLLHWERIYKATPELLTANGYDEYGVKIKTKKKEN